MTVGSSFVEQWRNWKTGLNKTQARLIEEVTEDIRSIFGFSSLEINASDQHKTLAISIDRKPYRLAELGSGLAQFILIFGNAAIKQPSLILIDEPEINLHPALQEAFVTALSKYADGNVVFATHSIGLARATAESIYSFRREAKGHPSVRIFEATRNYAEFVGEMSFSAYNELGCEAILLVEGVSDIKTVQQLLRILKQDARVVVIHLGGDETVRGGVEYELQELTRISKQVYALVDSERPGENENPHEKRLAFKKSCEALNIRAHLTERRDIENYFTNDAVRSALGDDHSALGEYESLKARAQGWSKTRDNWRIANRMRKVDLKNTDVGKFLLSIVGP